MNLVNFYNNENEQWKPLTAYNARDGKYAISNYGQIRREEDGYMLKPVFHPSDNAMYLSMHIQTNTSGRKTKTILLHRLVGEEFVNGQDQSNNTINHINNNGLDDRANNLEWMSQMQNNNYKEVCLNNNIMTNMDYYYMYNMYSNGAFYIDLKNAYPQASDEEIYNLIRAYYNANPNNTTNDSIRANSAKYTDDEVRLVYDMTKQNISYIEIAKALNKDISNINDKRSFNAFVNSIKNKKSYKHITCKED